MRMTTFLAGAMAASLALAGCTPVDTYSSNPNQRTKEGAITGAAIGAGLGLLTGKGGKNKRDRALAGAVIGGLGGAVIGNQLDKQAAELQSEIRDSRVRIINEGNQLRVVMPNGILFATDRSDVQPAIQNDLFALADNLNRYPNTRVEVIGHTDSDGSAVYNLDLSQRRANSVAAILRGAGVSPYRIRAYGAGEDQPVASNLTEAGKAQNRRVEILIIPNG
ncbi:MAG: OmpA family protein [Rhodobacteraceae bacterium]|nr:OmpA family protein [Paracoccaceae bacterium]